ncbi:MAG: hypothetical protein ABI321_07195 [Polyangia bacterium]
MDDLVRTLLADLSNSLDRLADELADDRPRLALTLRREADRSPLVAGEPKKCWRRSPLRPLLYRALDAGALDGPHFDRLMTVAARVRRRA